MSDLAPRRHHRRAVSGASTLVQLTVVGSSPAWPNPASAHAGYLLEGPGRLLLDCGPGVLPRLRATGGLDVDAVAITHFHLDHWGDLVPWAWLALYGTDATARPELWLPPGGRRALETFAREWGRDGMFDQAFAVREYRAAETFSAAGFDVEPHRVRHYTLEAYGFRVTEPETRRVLAYSGDCGPGQELVELARGADLFVSEATLASPESDTDPRGHLSTQEAIAAADGPLLLTHRPVELPVPDGIRVATDGLVLDV
jgi:ribonuclease BN (tRNA processing enzyme)